MKTRTLALLLLASGLTVADARPHHWCATLISRASIMLTAQTDDALEGRIRVPRTVPGRIDSSTES